MLRRLNGNMGYTRIIHCPNCDAKFNVSDEVVRILSEVILEVEEIIKKIKKEKM